MGPYALERVYTLRSFRGIGDALGKICRYGGRGAFYPVLAHSLVVGELLDPTIELHGLLHDAAEIFCGDPSRGFKTAVQRALEDEVLQVIYRNFDIPWPAPWVWRRVAVADDDAAHAEWDIVGPAKTEPMWDVGTEAASVRAREATARYAGWETSAWLDGTAAAGYARRCCAAYKRIDGRKR